jgi:hypothetical protein
MHMMEFNIQIYVSGWAEALAPWKLQALVAQEVMQTLPKIVLRSIQGIQGCRVEFQLASETNHWSLKAARRKDSFLALHTSVAVDGRDTAHKRSGKVEADMLGISCHEGGLNGIS